MTTISDQSGKLYSRLDEQENDVSDDPEDETSADDDDEAAASVFRGTTWDQSEKDHSPAKDSLRNSLHRETHYNDHQLEHRANNSFEMDDDDWDEDEASLRRYNLDYKTEIPTNFRPAEFDSLPKRLCKCDLRNAGNHSSSCRCHP